MKKVNHGHRWTNEELRELLGMWMRGDDSADIAKHFGVTPGAFSKQILRFRRDGVPIPRRSAGHKLGRSNKPWTQQEVEYLVRRRADSVTAEQIGVELGRTFQAVQNMIQTLRANGVAVKMLGNGVRRLWSADAIREAQVGRGLGADD